jgi:chemotaxis protein methyltransferase CheR
MPDVIASDGRERLRELVVERLGFARSPSQEYRIDDAVERLLAEGGLPSVARAFAALSSQPFESPPWQLVIDALVVGETNFFRHAAWFAQLEEHVLKPLVETRRRNGTKRLRLWSAACATGEEAYTLALIVKRLIGLDDGWDVRITGTDINERSLEKARRAVYREWSLREVEPALRRQYFLDAGDGRFELAPQLRERVTFQMHDLAADGIFFEPMDLIVCRNVLMYFTPERQAVVASRLIAALAQDGWLAVAPAEASAEAFRPLLPFNVPSAIFFHHAATPASPLRAKV